MTILAIHEQQLPGEPAPWTPAQRTRNQPVNTFLHPACTDTGIDLATIWRWREQTPAFKAAVLKFKTQTRMAKLEDNMYRVAE